MEVVESDLRELWPWLVLPILPLVGGLVVLRILYAPEFAFSGAAPDAVFTASFADATERGFLTFERLVVYGSAMLFHLALCLLALAFFAGQITRLANPQRGRSWRLIGYLALILVIAAALARYDGTALTLTYRNVCALLLEAEVASHLLQETCIGGSLGLLAGLASIPTLAGLIVAVFATAVANTVAAPLPGTSESAWQEAFAMRIRTLQRALYALSPVLVTSTITIMLFFQLPAAIEAEAPTAAVITSYARGMTTLWGTVFTLTLLAIFAPSLSHLLAEARRHEHASDQPSEVRAWLGTHAAPSSLRQLGNVAALLAPLLVGPLAPVLETLAGLGQ